MSKYSIVIKHVVSGEQIQFEPYITKFGDNYKSDWKPEYVIGRMDGIHNFNKTTRSIPIAFNVPSTDIASAKINYNKSKKLASFLYPYYKTTKIDEGEKSVNNEFANLEGQIDATTENFYKAIKLSTTLEERLNIRKDVAIMSSSPILSIKFCNLISDQNGQPLYGYVEGYNYNPDIEMGFFVDDEAGELIPKVYSVDFNFTVIHTQPLGWTSDGEKTVFRGPK